MDQKKIFELSDNPSYTTLSYAVFTVLGKFKVLLTNRSVLLAHSKHISEALDMMVATVLGVGHRDQTLETIVTTDHQ